MNEPNHAELPAPTAPDPEAPDHAAVSSGEPFHARAAADPFRTRRDDDLDRLDAEMQAMIEADRQERAERAKLPPPLPLPPAKLTLTEIASPEQIAEQLLVFYGVATARQIREGLVQKLRVFRHRRSATWDLVRDDLLAPRPVQVE